MSREEDKQKPDSLVVVFVRSGKLTYNEDFWQDEVADYPVREHGRLQTTCLRFSTDGHGRLQMMLLAGLRSHGCCVAGELAEAGGGAVPDLGVPTAPHVRNAAAATSLTTLSSALRPDNLFLQQL